MQFVMEWVCTAFSLVCHDFLVATDLMNLKLVINLASVMAGFSNLGFNICVTFVAITESKHPIKEFMCG